ncbi:MAG: hypothetical protein WC683_04085 [bacterium]
MKNRAVTIPHRRREDMSVKVIGGQGGYVVVVRGWGFVTRSNPLTKREAVRLARDFERRPV